jgi:hypothetical protein
MNELLHNMSESVVFKLYNLKEWETHFLFSSFPTNKRRVYTHYQIITGYEL